MTSKEQAGQHEEYLRRDLLVCSAIGARASAATALQRLQDHKNPPKWLIAVLEGIVERTAPLSTDLAAWRDTAPDRPDWKSLSEKEE